MLFRSHGCRQSEVREGERRLDGVQGKGRRSIAGTTCRHNERNVEYLQCSADIVEQYEVHHQHDCRNLYVFENLSGTCAVGSNIFNLMVVIGVCAMIATVEVARETIRRDIPLSLICAGLLLLLGTMGLGDQANMTLGHFDGVIFIGLFAGYIFYMIRIALKANKEGKKVEIGRAHV